MHYESCRVSFRYMMSPPRFYVSMSNFDSSFIRLHVFGVKIDILGWRVRMLLCACARPVAVFHCRCPELCSC
ncbi:hypothetical protein M6B38_214295 [Iris pallida]|uniref:Uncharacterized protein n=1 Tax=Iris pallida TaxID=29817 RepID=A0AAX6E239_IRIPA|nr:hypothetical protein M6B38_214295 [Iris pallida]